MRFGKGTSLAATFTPEHQYSGLPTNEVMKVAAHRRLANWTLRRSTLVVLRRDRFKLFV
jgi:hypothetical protein